MSDVPEGYKMSEVGVIPEEWEVKTLGEIANFYSGGTPSTSNSAYYGGEIAWITSSDLNKKIIFSVEGRITQQGLENSSAKMVEENTLLIALYGATAAVTAITKIKAAINQAVLAIIPQEHDTQYLYYKISSLKTWIINTYTQGGQPNLSGNIVKSIALSTPPLPEQQAIASALSDVDALITALEQLITKKRNIKQGAMQQLLTGKKRLPGFGGAWEVKKLGEICNKFLNGGTPSTLKAEYWNGNIPWISGADIVTQKISTIRRFISEDAVKNSSTNIVEKGNLLLVTRTGVGKMTIAPFDIAISQDLTGIYIKSEEVYTEYVFHYFDFNSTILKSLNQGTSISGITRDTLTSTPILLPSTIEEQQVIAQILSDMDAEIEALEQKQAKYKAIKQGMMQELLTGKTRLV